MNQREHLEALVKKHHMSHHELATHLGVSRVAITNWLSGKREVPPYIKRTLEILRMIEVLVPSVHAQIIFQAKVRASIYKPDK